MKGRKEFQDDLEDSLFRGSKRIIEKFSIYKGSQRGKADTFNSVIFTINYEEIGQFKFIFVRDEKELISISKIHNFLISQLKLKKYAQCNVGILSESMS